MTKRKGSLFTIHAYIEKVRRKSDIINLKMRRGGFCGVWRGSLVDVHDFAMTYGGLGMSFCHNDTYGIINQAMVDYYRLFSDPNEVDLPVTVLNDEETDI